VDCEPVATDARLERLVYEIQFKAELVTIVRNRSIYIIDDELWRYALDLRGVADWHAKRLNGHDRRV
jgi:hypothetical protein